MPTTGKLIDQQLEGSSSREGIPEEYGLFKELTQESCRICTGGRDRVPYCHGQHVVSIQYKQLNFIELYAFTLFIHAICRVVCCHEAWLMLENS